MRNKWNFLFGLGFLLTFVSAYSQPRLVLSDDRTPDVTEVRQAAKSFLLDLADEKYDDARKTFAGDNEAKKILERYIAACQQCQELTKLCRSKLGDAPEFTKLTPVAELRALADFYGTSPAVIAPNDASLPSLTAPSAGGIKLQRKNGLWQVSELVANPTLKTLIPDYLSLKQEVQKTAVERIQSRGLSSIQELITIFNDAGGERNKRFWQTHKSQYKPVVPPTTRAKPPVDSANELRSFIGKHIRSDEVRVLISRMSGLPTIGLMDTRLILHNYETGLNIIFDGSPQCVVSVTIFNTDSEESLKFTGGLPNGLDSRDTRHDVEAKIGKSTRSGQAFGYYADYDQLGLHVDYVNDDPRDPNNRIQSFRLTDDDASATKLLNGDHEVLAIRPVLSGSQSVDADSMLDTNAPGQPWINVSRTILISEKDLEEVTPIMLPDRNRLELYLKLKKDPANRMEKFTREHVGDSVAIVVDGRVVATLKIPGALSDSVGINFANGNPKDDLKEFRAISGRLHAAVYQLPATATTPK